MWILVGMTWAALGIGIYLVALLLSVVLFGSLETLSERRKRHRP